MTDQILDRIHKVVKENWGTPEHLEMIRKHNEEPTPLLKYFPEIKEKHDGQ